MTTTFETLSDEILMLIFKYSGDISTIFQTYLGLNYRFNSILLDKRLHLFTDFLRLNPCDPMFDIFYNSNECQQIYYELLYRKSMITDQELRQYLQQLVRLYIQEKRNYFGKQSQVDFIKFQTIREQLTETEMSDVDDQIKQVFYNLENNSPTIESIRCIESLVFIRGARLQFIRQTSKEFGFAQALDKYLFYPLNNTECGEKVLMKPMTQMFKTLLLSNIDHVKDCTYSANTSNSVWYFLFHWIYDECEDHIKFYEIVDLLLFIIEYDRQMDMNHFWENSMLFHILWIMPSNEVSNKNGLFMYNIQMEILNFAIDEYNRTKGSWWIQDTDNFMHIFRKLFKNNRLDVILLIYHRLEQVQTFFNDWYYMREHIKKIPGSVIGKQLLDVLLDEKPRKTSSIDKCLIFLLLQKKERKYLEKLLKLSPSLIHQLDQYGNDPLLYICLKVRGCRHRFIKYLITLGSDIQRRNLNGENFFDAIQLKQNRNLLEKLLDHEIVQIDHLEGHISCMINKI